MVGAKKIFLLDDDVGILTSVKMLLEEEGFEVHAFSNPKTVIEKITDNDIPHLIILDIKMPIMTGTEALSKIKEVNGDVPTIFLTSKDDEMDEIHGLSMGADDYVKKPFSQHLLLARIKSVLRRYEAEEVVSEDLIKRGYLELNVSKHLCKWKDTPIEFTVTEFLLLQTLATHPGHIKNRQQLIDEAYGENIYVDDRTIDSHVKRIRKKFKKIDDSFDCIETLYGVGYKYKEV